VGTGNIPGTGFLYTLPVWDMGFTKGPEEALEELERFGALSTSQPVPGDGRKRSGWGIVIRALIPVC